VWVIPTDEDLMIARHTYNLLCKTMKIPNMTDESSECKAGSITRAGTILLQGSTNSL